MDLYTLEGLPHCFHGTISFHQRVYMATKIHQRAETGSEHRFALFDYIAIKIDVEHINLQINRFFAKFYREEKFTCLYANFYISSGFFKIWEALTLLNVYFALRYLGSCRYSTLRLEVREILLEIGILV